MRDLIGITYDAVSGGPELTAAEWRQTQADLFVRDTNELVIGGIRGGSVSNVAAAVTITPLTIVSHPSAARGVYQGSFPAGSAELSQTITAAHATLPRVDAVDVKIFDHEADASTFRGVDIQLNAGTANASPVAPTFSGTGFRLGTFAVPASGGGSPAWTPNSALVGYAGTGGALDAASHPANVKAGTLMYNRATGGLEYYNGTSWFSVATGRLAKNTDGNDLTALNNTDPTWAAGSPACGVTFKAPASGTVDIIPTAHIQQNSVGGFAYLSFELRTGAVIGSGTLVQSPFPDNGVGTGNRVSASRHCSVAGLTPGADYNVRTMHTTSAPGATGFSLFYREISVYAV